MMATSHLFLSHSHKDNLWCDQFVVALSALGYEVWYDRQGLYVGAQWVQAIQRELAQCDVFVVILTPDSMASDWVQEEIAAALALHKQIVGVMPRHTLISPFLASRQILQVEHETPAAAASLVVKGLDNDTSKPRLNSRPGQARTSAFDTVRSVRMLLTLPATNFDRMGLYGIGYKRIAWSPDGKRLAVAGLDSLVRIWNWQSQQIELTLSGHTKLTRSVAWAPDGARILTGSDDKTARLWDAQTGNSILAVSGHSGMLMSVVVAWSPDGARFATACGDYTFIWDARTGQKLKEYKTHIGTTWGTTTVHNGVSWSRDGARVATVHANKSDILVANTGARSVGSSEERYITSIVWAPDNTRIATGSYEKSARIWDPDTGATLNNLIGHTGYVNDIDWSPDSRHVVTASDDGTVRVWDAHTGQSIQTTVVSGSSLYNVAWSPDGVHLATAHPNQGTQLWELS